jgi:hypothetical protein
MEFGLLRGGRLTAMLRSERSARTWAIWRGGGGCVLALWDDIAEHYANWNIFKLGTLCLKYSERVHGTAVTLGASCSLDQTTISYDVPALRGGRSG